MGFDGEFASYEPLRRILNSEKIKAIENRMRIREVNSDTDTSFETNLVHKQNLPQSIIQPDLILAIDGSNLTAKAVNGFPGAEIGYVTVASVLIDLKLVRESEKEELVQEKHRKTAGKSRRKACKINSLQFTRTFL